MIVYSLRTGDKGQEVARLQRTLGNLTIDGDFGPNTNAAVQVYQNSNGLLVDGVAGPITLGALGIPVLPGLDVSAWNGKIDWKRVAATGNKYCWIKATEGQTHINRGHEDKFKGARDHGLIVGGYHFGRPDYNDHDDPIVDAVREAHHFLTVMTKVGINTGDLLPVLDVEKGMKTDDQYNVEWNLAWLDEIEKELGPGVKPVVYTAKWAWNLYLAKANKSDLRRLTEYPLWWAAYNTGIDPSPKKCVRGWEEWNIWQWTGHGAVDGIKGRCDQNWMAGGQLDKLLLP